MEKLLVFIFLPHLFGCALYLFTCAFYEFVEIFKQQRLGLMRKYTTGTGLARVTRQPVSSHIPCKAHRACYTNGNTALKTDFSIPIECTITFATGN